MGIIREVYAPGYIFELSGRMKTAVGTAVLEAKSENAGDGHRKLRLMAYRDGNVHHVAACLTFERPCSEILRTAYTWVKDGKLEIGVR